MRLDDAANQITTLLEHARQSLITALPNLLSAAIVLTVHSF